MFWRKNFTLFILLLSCLSASGKDKKKALLPADVLQARTVLVLVDPDAGESIRDPNANRNAREAVEKALANWGRFSLVMEETSADLVITVRKGNGNIAEPSIGGVPVNNRPVVLQPADGGGRGGVGVGRPPVPGDGTDSQYPSQGPHPQAEIGSSQDMFVVYRGNHNNDPLAAPSVWRYTAKNALQSPSVPAVEEFRKLIAEAEKQAAAKP
ncbi:MAG TPA: hypothetical protein VGG85_10295 [Terracidiphilus sp.]|jgi:hypothetical protein